MVTSTSMGAHIGFLVLLVIFESLGDHFNLVGVLLLSVLDDLVVGVVCRAWASFVNFFDNDWELLAIMPVNWLRTPARSRHPLIGSLRTVPPESFTILWFGQLLPEQVELEGHFNGIKKFFSAIIYLDTEVFQSIFKVWEHAWDHQYLTT